MPKFNPEKGVPSGPKQQGGIIAVAGRRMLRWPSLAEEMAPEMISSWTASPRKVTRTTIEELDAVTGGIRLAWGRGRRLQNSSSIGCKKAGLRFCCERNGGGSRGVSRTVGERGSFSLLVRLPSFVRG